MALWAPRGKRQTRHYYYVYEQEQKEQEEEWQEEQDLAHMTIYRATTQSVPLSDGVAQPNAAVISAACLMSFPGVDCLGVCRAILSWMSCLSVQLPLPGHSPSSTPLRFCYRATAIDTVPHYKLRLIWFLVAAAAGRLYEDVVYIAHSLNLAKKGRVSGVWAWLKRTGGD